MRSRLGSLGLLVVTALALVHCSVGAGSAPSEGPAQVVRHGDPGRMVVVLTFDAGYESVYTDQILDTLKEKGVKASFGMTGAFAERYPDLLRRIANEGHQLFNHSYQHLSFTGQSTQKPALTEAELRDEFDKTEAIIKKITGVSTKPYFRPPYGDYNDSVNVEAYARGYRYDILWSVETRGWQAVPPDQIIPTVLSQVRPGAIILFHLGVVQDAVALPAIIDGLQSMGYGFVTLPELIAAGSIGP